ncbi:MAG TPA: diguanylate cyclase [Acetobacteraceae bacterium]|nr:diguanylate cyclase [Acetobacteraceae bacterium]
MSDSTANDTWRPGLPGRLAGPLRTVLLESRQRWRDFVALAADLAFETDEAGRFTFVAPESALGWTAGVLLEQPAASLLACNRPDFPDPFRPAAVIQRRRVWLRRGDGGNACVVLSVAPLTDRQGRRIGARGIVTDITEQEGQEAGAAAALRRAEVIEHVLARMRQEVLAPRMMRAVLATLSEALGAQGAAVLGLLGPQLQVLHETGSGAAETAAAAERLLRAADPQSGALTGEANGRPLLVSACVSRFGDLAGLALWRCPAGRGWDADDEHIAAAAMTIVRVVLEHEAIQREMATQARTDPLTGLLNRRAFFEELPRHAERLDREALPGTLLYIDLDRFKSVNDELGHETGDELLCCLADLLRNAFRPTDLVARLGGDEFAVWLNGADHLTAAERAEWLRVEVPRRFAALAPGLPELGLSVGIATRRAGNGEDLESVMRRADLAMYEVKRGGRGHWRVAHEEPP